jgi:hypothetical protein
MIILHKLGLILTSCDILIRFLETNSAFHKWCRWFSNSRLDIRIFGWIKWFFCSCHYGTLHIITTHLRTYRMQYINPYCSDNLLNSLSPKRAGISPLFCPYFIRIAAYSSLLRRNISFEDESYEDTTTDYFLMSYSGLNPNTMISRIFFPVIILQFKNNNQKQSCLFPIEP